MILRLRSVIVAAVASWLPVAVAGVDGLDQVPRVISQDAPEYPFSLRLNGNKGEVLVEFTVDPDGTVSNPLVVKSSHPDFEAPAVEAILKWRFKPGMKDGHPVHVRLRVPVLFQLRGFPNDGGGAEVWHIPPKGPKDVPARFQYDEPPKPLVTSAPVYPFDQLVHKAKGRATVLFAVDEFGGTHIVKVADSSAPEFGAAAAAMIEAWSFEPARKAGSPCWALLVKEQKFSMDSDDFPVDESAERILKDLKRAPCPVVMDAHTLDRPLGGRYQPPPVVPTSVLDSHKDAEAVIEFVVDRAGHARLPRIVSSSSDDFGWAAATAVGRWQYTSPTLHGRPVDVFVRVPLVYTAEIPAPAQP
jgi:TonB family protein